MPTSQFTPATCEQCLPAGAVEIIQWKVTEIENSLHATSPIGLKTPAPPLPKPGSRRL